MKISIKVVTGRSKKITFDYKKEYKEFYMPKSKLEIVNVQGMKLLQLEKKVNQIFSTIIKWYA